MTPAWVFSRGYGVGPGRFARHYSELPEAPPDDPQPPRPDWLLLLTIGLFILTLLIAWATNLSVSLNP